MREYAPAHLLTKSQDFCDTGLRWMDSKWVAIAAVIRAVGKRACSGKCIGNFGVSLSW